MENQKLKKRKRSVSCFKDNWLTEIVMTSTSNCYDLRRTTLSDIFAYDPDTGITCLYYRDAKKQVDLHQGRCMRTPESLIY